MIPDSILQKVSEEDRARASEIIRTSPEIVEGVTALDWIEQHEEGIYGQAAKIIKAIGGKTA